MANPAKDVADYLISNVSGLTLGANIFYGPRRPHTMVETDSVFVIGKPGLTPTRSMGQISEMRIPHVHVAIRWSSFEEGDSKAREIIDSLQGASISGYQDVELVNSEPDPVELDDQGNQFWLIVVRLQYEKVK